MAARGQEAAGGACVVSRQFGVWDPPAWSDIRKMLPPSRRPFRGRAFARTHPQSAAFPPRGLYRPIFTYF